jgi:segregation and condensation protein A
MGPAKYAQLQAVLEMAKRGQVALRQGDTFGPLQIRRRES